MQILLEYKESRRQLEIPDPDNIYDVIEDSLIQTGWSGRMLLCFITGSSVVLADTIDVTFNATSGLSRFPIVHTCSPAIELPLTYSTYPDFEHNFRCILDNEYSWLMDSI